MNPQRDKELIDMVLQCRTYLVDKLEYILSMSNKKIDIELHDENIFDSLGLPLENYETYVSHDGISVSIKIDDIIVDCNCNGDSIYFSNRTEFVDGPEEIFLETPKRTMFHINNRFLTIEQINKIFNLKLPENYFEWELDDITMARMVI